MRDGIGDASVAFKDGAGAAGLATAPRFITAFDMASRHLAVHAGRARIREGLRVLLQQVTSPHRLPAAQDRWVPARVGIVDAMPDAPHPDEPRILVVPAPTAAQRVRALANGAITVLDARASADTILEQIRACVARLMTCRAHPSIELLPAESPMMQALKQQALRTAGAGTSLLITGETGVGKEFLARAIHASGPRRRGPFLAVNCGALTEQLLESQLFGHERGAFTGADRLHKGYFEAANGGTLLLDEICEMPLHLQVKLLTALERHEVMRLGSHTPTKVDVRVMAATNRDVDAEVANGRLRSDLYYRLDVIHLRIPPLRQRREDLPEIIGNCFREHLTNLEIGRFAGISDDAVSALLAYQWPGNVRQLRNVLERALVLGCGEVIGPADLALELPDMPGLPAMQGMPADPDAAFLNPARWEGMTLRQARDSTLTAMERVFLQRLLEVTKGRVGRTAALAGIRPRSLYDKMKQHGLHKEQFRPARGTRVAR